MELWQIEERYRGYRPTLQGTRGEYSVLVPLVQRPDGFHLLYEVRASSLRNQPGEVCFPGGRMEPGESPVDCALRETREELGLSSGVRVIAPLDFLIRGSSIIYPVLASVDAAAERDLRLNGDEVSGCFTVPLTWLRDNPPEIYRDTLRPDNRDFPYEAAGVSPDYPWSPVELEVPIYRGLSHPLWGITARITARFIEQIYGKKDI